jgi:hypothetical protein
MPGAGCQMGVYNKSCHSAATVCMGDYQEVDLLDLSLRNPLYWPQLVFIGLD